MRRRGVFRVLMILRIIFSGEGRKSDVEFNTDFHVFWADFHNMCLSVPRLCYLCLLCRLRGSYVRQSAVKG